MILNAFQCDPAEAAANEAYIGNLMRTYEAQHHTPRMPVYAPRFRADLVSRIVTGLKGGPITARNLSAAIACNHNDLLVTLQAMRDSGMACEAKKGKGIVWSLADAQGMAA